MNPLLGPARPAAPRSAPAAPLLSVVIPAYNRPELLRETLASVSALSSTGSIEVVVCDDLGLAATRAAVESAGLPQVRYLRNLRPLGAVGNWNRGLAEARGDWVTILHEDDLLYPWFLDLVRPRLRPGLTAVGVRCARGAAAPRLDRPTRPVRVRRWSSPLFLKSAFTPFPGVLFPRELALAIGGFDEARGPLADYDFWYRMSHYGEVELLDTVGAFYRVSEGQWTARAWPHMLRQTHLLRRQIAREQLPSSPRLGVWLARFFTHRNGRAYARRFTGTPPLVLRRVERLGASPLRFVPSGWVWFALRLLAAQRPAPRRTPRPPPGFLLPPPELFAGSRPPLPP